MQPPSILPRGQGNGTGNSRTTFVPRHPISMDDASALMEGLPMPRRPFNNHPNSFFGASQRRSRITLQSSNSGNQSSMEDMNQPLDLSMKSRNLESQRRESADHFSPSQQPERSTMTAGHFPFFSTSGMPPPAEIPSTSSQISITGPILVASTSTLGMQQARPKAPASPQPQQFPDNPKAFLKDGLPKPQARLPASPQPLQILENSETFLKDRIQKPEPKTPASPRPRPFPTTRVGSSVRKSPVGCKTPSTSSKISIAAPIGIQRTRTQPKALVTSRPQPRPAKRVGSPAWRKLHVPSTSSQTSIVVPESIGSTLGMSKVQPEISAKSRPLKSPANSKVVLAGKLQKAQCGTSATPLQLPSAAQFSTCKMPSVKPPLSRLLPSNTSSKITLAQVVLKPRTRVEKLVFHADDSSAVTLSQVKRETPTTSRPKDWSQGAVVPGQQERENNVTSSEVTKLIGPFIKFDVKGFSNNFVLHLEEHYTLHRNKIVDCIGRVRTPCKFLQALEKLTSIPIFESSSSIRNQIFSEIHFGGFCGIAYSRREGFSRQLAAALVLYRIGQHFKFPVPIPYALLPGSRYSGVKRRLEYLCRMNQMEKPAYSHRKNSVSSRNIPGWTCEAVVNGNTFSVQSDDTMFGTFLAAKLACSKIFPNETELEDYFGVGHECPRKTVSDSDLQFRTDVSKWMENHGLPVLPDISRWLHDEGNQSQYLTDPAYGKPINRFRVTLQSGLNHFFAAHQRDFPFFPMDVDPYDVDLDPIE